MDVGLKEAMKLRTEGPLGNGELVVRFFGMKDDDGTLKVAAKLSSAVIEVGPFELKGKKHKLVPKGGPATSISGSMSPPKHSTLTSTSSSVSSSAPPHSSHDSNASSAPPKKMKIHSGFWHILQEINRGCLMQHGRDLVEQIAFRAGGDMTKRVIFTGHSMGACLAAATAYQLIQRYPGFKLRLYLVLFGSPRWARKPFYKWLNKNLRNRIMNIILTGDSTVKSPPSPPFFGWYAPGVPVRISPGNMFEEYGGKDHYGNAVHFQYWQVLRSILAYA
jgi:hypothetical protein